MQEPSHKGRNRKRLELRSMNREDVLFLSRSWKPLLPFSEIREVLPSQEQISRKQDCFNTFHLWGPNESVSFPVNSELKFTLSGKNMLALKRAVYVHFSHNSTFLLKTTVNSWKDPFHPHISIST
jgi:hypothetical protein